jgi:2-polyprenyl-3-methyl-5-hydroxy-6-metoxy-1,4-benzoquinol methylase
MRQIVKDYQVIVDLEESRSALGGSMCPKSLIKHALKQNDATTNVLDIGFGSGDLGSFIRSDPDLAHWQIDGIDGWLPNVMNKSLFDKKLYRNIWHGLVQNMPIDLIQNYKIICLLDVIEHLNIETSKWLLRTLLTYMGHDSVLFISTPLFFWPQEKINSDDLEEHLIGIPATSMLALVPRAYMCGDQLVCGFILCKESLDYVDFFQPTADKGFTYDKGMKIANHIGLVQNKTVVKY